MWIRDTDGTLTNLDAMALVTRIGTKVYAYMPYAATDDDNSRCCVAVRETDKEARAVLDRIALALSTGRHYLDLSAPDPQAAPSPMKE